jgi:hypothetical protein
MAGEEHVSVAVRDDFVARQTKAKPVPALAELLWNSLDGDATEVSVEFAYNDLAGGVSKIVVYDNGDGFSRSDARALFGNLGGSWKRHVRQTKRNHRMIHGKEGRGRYKAFALGQSIIWKVCYDDPSGRKAFEVRLLEANLTDVTITEEALAPGRSTGVIVEIDDLRGHFKTFESEDGLQDLNEIFALYLMNYQDVSISIAGHRLDPEKVIASYHKSSLPPIEKDDGARRDVELEVIEWRTDARRVLYLCSASGFPFDQVETRFHIPGFSFSAYLKSTYVEELHNEERIALSEMDPLLTAAVENARSAIKDHFRDKSAEKARSLVDEWIAEDVYPYRGTPQNAIEKVERQVFDIVAVQVQELAPDLGISSAKAKALANLLQETTLSAIITAAKTVADRLKFISALESIVFDPETKGRLKERTQLHKILAENTWVFGEEYNLWVSDKDLRRVLEKHRDHLDPNIAIDEPVKVIGKTRGIIDLMFSRSTRRHRANDIEHMIVELKAPKVKIGADEITQAKKYAIAVTSDERFSTVNGVRWHFWLVSNAYDDFAKHEIESGPDRERRLIARGPRHIVGIKTWGELIEENRARLQFFQEHLQHSADESTAIRYLQEKHSQFLEGVIVADADENGGDQSEALTRDAAERSA